MNRQISAGPGLFHYECSLPYKWKTKGSGWEILESASNQRNVHGWMKFQKDWALHHGLQQNIDQVERKDLSSSQSLCWSFLLCSTIFTSLTLHFNCLCCNLRQSFFNIIYVYKRYATNMLWSTSGTFYSLIILMIILTIPYWHLCCCSQWCQFEDDHITKELSFVLKGYDKRLMNGKSYWHRKLIIYCILKLLLKILKFKKTCFIISKTLRMWRNIIEGQFWPRWIQPE